MKGAIILFIAMVAMWSPVEAAMSTYKGYTLISWINPFNSYAKVIKTYVGYIRTYYWNLWGLLQGKVVRHGGRYYGDLRPVFEELSDMGYPDEMILRDLAQFQEDHE